MKRNIWVEKLGVSDLIAFFIETLFSAAFVRYDEKQVSSLVTRLIAILQHCGLCRNFHPAKLMFNKKDTAGYALNYHMENNLDLCLSEFCDKYIKNESVRFKGAVRTYIAIYLIHRSTFVTMVENEPEFMACGTENIIYLRGNPFNSVIIPHYRRKGYIIRESALSSDYLVQYLKPFYRLWSIMFAKFSPRNVKTDISKPSIWVEYVHGGGIDHIPWRKNVDEDMFDIVYYLDRNDKYSLSEKTQEIEKKQLKCIDLHFHSLVKFAGIGMREVTDMCCTFFYPSSGIPIWFRVFKFEFRMQYLLYKSVFHHFKVKVLLQHQEALWIQEPQRAALEAAGGIMVGFHWSSIQYYKASTLLNPQHVYFVWGKIGYDWMQKRVNLCRYVLPAGLWLKPSESSLGIAPFKDGLKFIVAIFDSSVTYDIYQAEETLDAFYLKALEMLEKNPEWGGIIKSKNWSKVNDLEFLPHGKEIVSKATSFIKQKRLVFLDNKISPITASAHADISVCYGLNSAGIISGICGHKTAHWDCTGWLNNPFYQDKEQRFLFDTLDDMEDAIVKASQGDAAVGDFSAWRQKIDYFNDDAGPERIGEFIQDFMLNVTKTNDAATSLEETVKRYHAVNNIDDSFFGSDNLWEDEKIGKC